MKEYKVVSLSGESDQQSDRINEAAKEGFEFLKLVQGFRQSDNSWRIPSILMVREVMPCA